ncbi:MAG: hypothetical protein ACI9MS_003543 [Glaciecola sp.]|jgi:hypothetical protein
MSVLNTNAIDLSKHYFINLLNVTLTNFDSCLQRRAHRCRNMYVRSLKLFLNVVSLNMVFYGYDASVVITSA